MEKTQWVSTCPTCTKLWFVLSTVKKKNINGIKIVPWALQKRLALALTDKGKAGFGDSLEKLNQEDYKRRGQPGLPSETLS